jgi:hypothetical protein
VLVLLALAVVWQVISFVRAAVRRSGMERIWKSLVSLRCDFVLVTLARVLAAWSSRSCSASRWR